MTEYTVSTRKGKSIISNRLFGANLEMTRRTGFKGLYAQMINNRKFFAHEEEEVCGFVYDGNVYYSTDTEQSMCHSNFFVIPQDGMIISKEDNLVCLQKGREYLFSFWASGSGELCVRFANAYTQTVKIDADKPAKFDYKFAAAVDEDAAAMVIDGVSGKVNLYCVSLMPADHFHNMRRDVVECLKQLSPAQLRFPGGCFADHYNWKESLLEADLRTPVDGKVMPFLLRDTYHQDCVEISVDDFMALCKYIGAEPELTVRMVHAPMQEAVDLVEYCNGDATTKWGKIREERGYSKYNVKEWYVGNEIYSFGRDEEKDLVKDPIFAAKETKKYIAAMKKVDPTIITLATCNTEVPHWNTPYFENSEDAVDRYSYHCYLTCEFDKSWGNTPKDKILMTEDGRMVIGLQKTIELLKTAKSDRHHAVSYDEWNFAWGQKGSTQMFIYDALVFNFLCREADKYLIEKSLFFHPVNEGMILVHDKYAEIDTAGKALIAMAPHRNAARMDVKTDSCEPYRIDLAASEKDGKVYLTAVNRQIEKPQKLRVNGLNLTGKKITVHTLIAEDFSLYNNKIDTVDTVITPDSDVLEYDMPALSLACITVK